MQGTSLLFMTLLLKVEYKQSISGVSTLHFSYPDAGRPSIEGQLKKYNLFSGFQQVTK
jgi:hypothetical protein